MAEHPTVNRDVIGSSHIRPAWMWCSGSTGDSKPPGVGSIPTVLAFIIVWGRAVRSARWAHNPEVVGSNPAPATKVL